LYCVDKGIESPGTIRKPRVEKVSDHGTRKYFPKKEKKIIAKI
jgi:hypothetical protein